MEKSKIDKRKNSPRKSSPKTPLMRQYTEFKEQFPDALLLFQVGDFYELFFEDAKQASAFLGIALTKRSNSGQDIPLCGFPIHAVDHYIIKLVKGGFRVVTCEQTSKPQPGKLVKRSVKQVLTPGTLTDIKMLEEKSASYLSFIFPTIDSFGILFLEVLTGQIFATTIERSDLKSLESELARFLPKEIVLPNSKLGKILESSLKKWGYIVSLFEFSQIKSLKNKENKENKEPETDEEFENIDYLNWLKPICSPTVFKFVESSKTLQITINLSCGYLEKHFPSAIEAAKQFFLYSFEDFLILDPSTQRNLELVKNLHDGSTVKTLFKTIDYASTSMGSRQIRKWILRPSVKKAVIEQRLDAVEKFISEREQREQIKKLLKQIGDLERITGRISLSRSNLHDYIFLTKALNLMPKISDILFGLSKIQLLKLIYSKIGNFSELSKILNSSLTEDLASNTIIKPGYSQELDKLRNLLENGTKSILEFERKEKDRTGIVSLKVKFSRVHGYGIEVTKANLKLVPQEYQRLQTLANSERFTTQKLRELEHSIKSAQSNSEELELKLFSEICSRVKLKVSELRKCSQALAYLDAIISLSDIAYERNYTRPKFDEKASLVVKNGRHPVVELYSDQEFIPNDTMLNNKENLWIITGPNMGGKSTYLRQVALISIMAQMGSFVPALKANLSIIDRIFTRIGSADNVAAGKSTFLVEMEETALICNRATKKSLVILDEVGRGTSTYDGMALAQAIIEYIYTNIKSNCLFATHYHELTDLEKKYPGIISYHTASKKTDKGILLLHKIIRGKADGSFGLEVAKLSGIPKEIIQRAGNILSELTD